jgi:sporulation protein YlmC with PRC-barrel domain
MTNVKHDLKIAMNVAVECTDGECGKSSRVVLNPVTQQLTHLVVEIARIPSTERVVPLAMVEDTSATTIRLSCTKEELKAMPDFIEHHYVEVEKPSENLMEGNGGMFGLAYAGPSALDPGYAPGMIMALPYAVRHEHYQTEALVVDSEGIPPDELAVQRGARVEASDGKVGQVDDFLVDSKSGHITHIILREGHLWNQKDVTIPVAQIEREEEDAVFLKLDKKAIEDLPAIDVQRWY